MTKLQPPIKTNGNKRKLTGHIYNLINTVKPMKRWVEPFLGSGIVALTCVPKDTPALLTDTNPYIIEFYNKLQSGAITPDSIVDHFRKESILLARCGKEYYMNVRSRFNITHDILDFLLLNRVCFNGVMRFNRSGGFNTPAGSNLSRYTNPKSLTRIHDIFTQTQHAIGDRWIFKTQDFETTLNDVEPDDTVYLDPPYFGLNSTYYTMWKLAEEERFLATLRNVSGVYGVDILLSTWNKWQSSKSKSDLTIRINGHVALYSKHLPNSTEIEHDYIVRSSNSRSGVTELLLSNFKMAIDK